MERSDDSVAQLRGVAQSVPAGRAKSPQYGSGGFVNYWNPLLRPAIAVSFAYAASQSPSVSLNLTSSEAEQSPASGPEDGKDNLIMERDQVEDIVAAAEARIDTKFEKTLGEFRLAMSEVRGEIRADFKELKAATAGRATVIGTGVAVVAISVALILGMMTVGQQWFGLGLQSHDVLTQAAREGAQQALAATKR